MDFINLKISVNKWLNFARKLTPLDIFIFLDPLPPPLTTTRTQRKKLIIECDGRFVCGVCHVSYSSRNGCYAHYECHLGSTTCDVCGKVLADKITLSRHKSKHAGNIRCDVCDKAYASIYMLRRHQQTSKCGKWWCSLSVEQLLIKNWLRVD